MEIPYQIHVHHDKKLKDYFFDFFMLFIAVSLGFFVENKREQLKDDRRERKYIMSLVNDLREDTVKVNTMLYWNNVVVKGLDTLVNVIRNYTIGDSALSRRMYSLYMSSARASYSVKFTDRTLASLRGASGRTIIAQTVADSILKYEEDVKIAMAQDVTYKDFWMRSLDLSTTIFDYKYISYKLDSATNLYNYENQVTYNLLENDPVVLARYANLLELWKQVTFVYLWNIQAVKVRAISLIPFLKEEYDLE